MAAEPRPSGGRPRRRRIVYLLPAAVVLLVILTGASFVAAEYTSRSTFCNSCHEMNRYYNSWHASAHADVPCKSCHVPPGVASFAKTKVFALREVYVHFTHQVKVPLGVTRHVSNNVCTRCHTDGGSAKVPTKVVLASSSFTHGFPHDGSCVRGGCHRRLVHQTVTPPTYIRPASMPACFACHTQQQTKQDCAYCHPDPPHDALGSCARCHSLRQWTIADFKHPFPLQGGHASVACTRCHPKASPGAGLMASGGKVRFDFGKASTTCVGCHGDHHGGLSDCERCHTPKGWTPADFTHPGVGPHVGASAAGDGERLTLQCTDCHDQGFGSASCSCHGGQRFGPGNPFPGNAAIGD